jgi:hypothetical protein
MAVPSLERTPRFAELDSSRIVDTIARLERRITARFPGSGLALVCHELRELAGGTQQHIEGLSSPIWPLRALAAIGAAAIAAIAIGLIVIAGRGLFAARGFVELVQGSESAVNQVLLLAMAVFFLVSMETRVKRHRALAALHRLRSVVHIVDMHQLTKDPEMTQATATTPASPARPHTPFELGRYLDYCSELFSLTSKVAALYGQSLKDPVVLDAVSDIETLSASLSNKVWQKIIVLKSSVSGLQSSVQPGL